MIRTAKLFFYIDELRKKIAFGKNAGNGAEFPPQDSMN
jgi:hypothetical protein